MSLELALEQTQAVIRELIEAISAHKKTFQIELLPTQPQPVGSSVPESPPKEPGAPMPFEEARALLLAKANAFSAEIKEINAKHGTKLSALLTDENDFSSPIKDIEKYNAFVADLLALGEE